MKTILKLVGGVILEIAVVTVVTSGSLLLTETIHGKVKDHKIKKEAKKKITKVVSLKDAKNEE